jgi:hypothetical protein
MEASKIIQVESRIPQGSRLGSLLFQSILTTCHWLCVNKSARNKVLLCCLNSTVNKAGPTGPCFVTPGLLFSRVVRSHKWGRKKITFGSEQYGWPLDVHRANINNLHVNLTWLGGEIDLITNCFCERY